MNIFKKIFGSKSKEDKSQKTEKTTFVAKTISKSDLAKMKTGDIITLGDKAKTTYQSKWIKAADNPYKRDIFDRKKSEMRNQIINNL